MIKKKSTKVDDTVQKLWKKTEKDYSKTMPRWPLMHASNTINQVNLLLHPENCPHQDHQDLFKRKTFYFVLANIAD